MIMRAIGLMSGTSMDGIDIALIETDGERISAFGPAALHFYHDKEREILRRAVAAAPGLTDRAARPPALAAAEAMVTAMHESALRLFLDANGIAPSSIDVVGFHGQTVLHRPERKLTVQLGDGRALARATGLRVVYDFRAADVEAGGQGAPFVPVFHRALVRDLVGARPVAIVNIGGVSNITYVDGDEMVACDTGPGNALIDDWMLRRTGRAMDGDGEAAARGRADEAWLARALALPFFSARPPKSLDRNAFAALSVDGMTVEDGAATLTAFTARAIAGIVPLLPKPPAQWIVTGGGARNPTLLRMLGEALAPAKVSSAKPFGWDGDAIEAQAFAFLAVRSLKGLPLSYPLTTGVARPQTGGVMAMA
jgi:anhydro-N-acetylmuramic acid kinase